MQWEKNILLQNQNVLYRLPFPNSLEDLNVLAHRSLIARSLPSDFLRFA